MNYFNFCNTLCGASIDILQKYTNYSIYIMLNEAKVILFHR